MACMFYFARCMNIIFNSLSSLHMMFIQLAKQNSYTPFFIIYYYFIAGLSIRRKKRRWTWWWYRCFCRCCWCTWLFPWRQRYCRCKWRHTKSWGTKRTVRWCVRWTWRTRRCHHLHWKNAHSAVCVMTPVLASTSRTQPPVITWWHLYWLQHQKRNHLWSRDDTCTGFNIKNTTTCDHVMTPVLASTSRTQPPVITWWHLYWLQHQELTHLWSRDDTCTGFNIKNSRICDHVMTPVLASTSRTQPPVMCTTIIRDSLHLSQTACSIRLSTV